MCTITTTELKTNFEKYNKLAQKECVQVTSHGKVIYELTPIGEVRKYKIRLLRDKCPKNIPFDSWKDRDI